MVIGFEASPKTRSAAARVLGDGINHWAALLRRSDAYAIVDTDAIPADYTPIALDFRYPATWIASFLRNPFAEVAESATFEWLEHLGVTPSAELRARVRHMNVAAYAGDSLPLARYEDLYHYSRLITLWLLWDDQVVEKRTDARIDAHLDQVLAALAGRLSPDACDDGYVRGWAELGQGFLRVGRSRHYVERVAACFGEWIGVSLREASFAHAVQRDARSLLADGRWAKILETRVVTIGMFPTAQMLEHVGGFELPDEVRRHAGIRRLTWLGSLLVALGNEVASAAKDLEAGWLNLVPAHGMLHGGDLQASYEAVVAMNRAAITEFDAIAATLPSWGAPDRRVGARVDLPAALLRERFYALALLDRALHAPDGGRHRAQAVLQARRDLIGRRTRMQERRVLVKAGESKSRRGAVRR